MLARDPVEIEGPIFFKRHGPRQARFTGRIKADQSPPYRLASRVDHDPREVMVIRRHPDIKVFCMIATAHRNNGGFRSPRRSRSKDNRTACGDGATSHLDRPAGERCKHDVLARRQTINAIATLIVRMRCTPKASPGSRGRLLFDIDGNLFKDRSSSVCWTAVGIKDLPSID